MCAEGEKGRSLGSPKVKRTGSLDWLRTELAVRIRLDAQPSPRAEMANGCKTPNTNGHRGESEPSTDQASETSPRSAIITSAERALRRLVVREVQFGGLH